MNVNGAGLSSTLNGDAATRPYAYTTPSQTTHALQSSLATSLDPMLEQLRLLVSEPIPIDDLRRLSGSFFSDLREQTREVSNLIRATKQATGEARHVKDQTHLGLQNLLYEQRHLEREIDKCRQFNSIYQDVPLHSEEEYLELAPEEARTPDILADQHQLMLHRLNFELSERIRLDKEKKQLAAEKERLLAENKKAEAELDALGNELDMFAKGANELQKKMSGLSLL